jgi:hypothetical protein
VYIGELTYAGIWDTIQVGSMYDYVNLTERVDFKKLKERLMGSISYRLITFPNAGAISRLPNLFQENDSQSSVTVSSDQNTATPDPANPDEEKSLGFDIAK